ncbi:MAG TPA: hypothetical protein VFJ82_16335 [Longimicrobium sp.]|nr:hypothetical protein [Longimicrobium sp.]
MSPLHQALPTLWLQLAFAALTLVFGLTALRVAPRPGGTARTDGWFLTGATFTTSGGIATVMGVAAFPAVAAPHSPLRTAFDRLSPIANDARGFALLGFSAALVHLVVLRQPAPDRRRTAAGLGLSLGFGAVVGAMEGSWVSSRQFTMMAVLSAVTVLVLFVVLYVALVRDTLDWLLWLTLALYAAREALCANLQALLTWFGMGGFRGPGPRPMLAAGVVSVLAMLLCTWHRLALARAGRETPGLLERLRA